MSAHKLRHDRASGALALDESLAMIGRLLGHSPVQTTARYAHLAKDPIQKTTARITASNGVNLAPRERPAAGTSCDILLATHTLKTA